MAQLADSQLSVLNCAAQADVEAAVADLRESGFEVLRIDGSEVRDQTTLLAAARRDVPGVEAFKPHNWSSFADAMGDDVFDFEERVALLWTDAHRMLEGGLADLLVATDLLAGLARYAYSQEVTFVTFMVGDGPNFPAWQPAG